MTVTRVAAGLDGGGYIGLHVRHGDACGNSVFVCSKTIAATLDCTCAMAMPVVIVPKP